MNFSIEVRNKDGLRTLHFESQCTQGAMRVGHPAELVLEYTRVMMAALLLRDADDWPRSILLVGLGAGSLLKFLHRHCPQARLTAVEISPRVVEVARGQFDLPDDTARIEIVVGDGADYMQRTQRTFDLILVDGFNEHAHPGDLNTLPFYQACCARLGDQGVLAVNLIGLCHGVKGGFAHIETAFAQRAVMFPRCKSGNTIAFAANGEVVEVALDALQRRAQALETRTGLALQPTIVRLGEELAGQDGRLRI
ncbi:MAG: methyltransferase domain-containing protein [Sideroxydans sp.]|nr:methyltransferase domain-containing protein [Sideroxydans sp.]